MNINAIIMIPILILVLNSTTFSLQNENKKYLCHGTVIAAAVCDDGILFVSDSRSSFTLNEQHANQVYAYIENDKKIFEIGKYLIGFSGISMLNKKFMIDIISEFNLKYPQNYDIETTLDKFISYLKNDQNVPDSILLENQIIIAGYENSMPMIIAQNNGDRMYQNKVAHMIHSDTELIRFIRLSPDIVSSPKNSTF